MRFVDPHAETRPLLQCDRVEVGTDWGVEIRFSGAPCVSRAKSDHFLWSAQVAVAWEGGTRAYSTNNVDLPAWEGL